MGYFSHIKFVTDVASWLLRGELVILQVEGQDAKHFVSGVRRHLHGYIEVKLKTGWVRLSPSHWVSRLDWFPG